MKYFGNGLSEMHKELNKIIRKPSHVEEAKQLFLELHALLHCSSMSGTNKNEVDTLFNDLSIQEYKVIPTAQDETIAWVLWHIARIEDLTMGILVARGAQVFNKDWQLRINSSITDTGNALSDEEIMTMSQHINREELLAYRNEVGKRTREIVKSLSYEDMIRRISSQDIERIKQVGGVTKEEDSLWLLDFWGKKDVAGLLLMPPTRHVMVHLNDCCKWKQHIREGKNCYRSM